MPRAALVLALSSLLAGALASVSVVAGEGPRRPPCPADAPQGVRLPDRPGCAVREGVLPRRAPPGVIDFGDGASLRVGGRVRGEVEVRR